MFDDSCVRAFFVRVVHGRISLEIRYRKLLHFETNFSVLQFSKAIVVVGIDSTGKDDFLCLTHPLLLLFQEVYRKLYRNALQHLLHHSRIALYRNPLIKCIEIVVVIGKSHGKSTNNGRRKIFAISSPLLLRIALDELFVNLSSDKGNSLLFQIFRLADTCSPPLLFNLFLRLFRRNHSPHRVKGIHIERKRINLSPIVRNGRVGKTVKVGKAIHIIPYLSIVGMENVRTVMVYHNSVFLIGIHISADMIPLIDYEHFLSQARSFVCKYRPKKSGSHYKIIQLFHIFLLCFSLKTATSDS